LATGGANEIDPSDPCPPHYVDAPSLLQPYEYDAHGNMTRMPHLPLMHFNFLDQLRATSRTEMNNGGTPQTTFYVYAAGGQRVRKITERQAGPGQTPTRQHERIYLGGFETYREYDNDGQTRTLERETLHVMDDQQRIAQIDTRTIGDDGSPEQSRRFQLGNHLGSVAVEVDENASLISFEEHHSYGTTAFSLVRSAGEGSLKRYRYTSKERDNENGLYYHGARYYACWLSRWTSADPSGIADGLNLFSYVGNRPMVKKDPTGLRGVTDTLADWETAAIEKLADTGKRIGKLGDELGDAVEQRTDAVVDGATQLAVEGPVRVYEHLTDEKVSEETKAQASATIGDLGKLALVGPSGAVRIAAEGVEAALTAPKSYDQSVQTLALGVDTGNAERIVAGYGGMMEHGTTIATTIVGATTVTGLTQTPKKPLKIADLWKQIKSAVRKNNSGKPKPKSRTKSNAYDGDQKPDQKSTADTNPSPSELEAQRQEQLQEIYDKTYEDFLDLVGPEEAHRIAESYRQKFARGFPGEKAQKRQDESKANWGRPIKHQNKKIKPRH
jgi:RHS repeat-associated protein